MLARKFCINNVALLNSSSNIHIVANHSKMSKLIANYFVPVMNDTE